MAESMGLPGRIHLNGDETTRKQRSNRPQTRPCGRRPNRLARRVALAVGGVAVAFGLVAFTPAPDLAAVLPVAVVITVAARLAAFAALRGAARKRLGLVLLAVRPGDAPHRPQRQHHRAAQQAVDGGARYALLG